VLEVTIYDAEGKETAVVESVDFVSIVNKDTYGAPPLIAPSKDSPRPLAQVGDRVLYINTEHVPMFEIERISDR
jgi:hypothetical protein